MVFKRCKTLRLCRRITLKVIEEIIVALSFTPLYHVESAPGVWLQQLSTPAPCFGRYPSIRWIKQVSDEAAAIKSQGEKVITMVFDPKPGDPSKLQAVLQLLK